MGYSFSTWFGDQIKYYIDAGPNQKNDLKLCLMRAIKLDGDSHTFSIVQEKRWKWGVGFCVEDVVVGVPTPEYVAKHKTELEEYKQSSAAYECTSYRRYQGKRRVRKPRKAPGRGKPELSEEDLLEEKLSQPRCRYQRGWKNTYCPTRKTWRRHDDHKNWKSHTKGQKSWDK